MKRFLFAIIALCTTLTSFGWGQKGHDVVAYIAECNLTPEVYQKVVKKLDNHSLVYYANWLDNASYSDQYRYTKTWHYANVDKGLTYQTMTKNPDGDVITGLEFITKELMENFDNLTDSTKADYVKMIVHMVGDMHCPMHAGRLSDRGGNGTKVRWFGQNTSLHSLWDSKMIDSARKWNYTEWVEQLDRTDKKFKKSVMCGTYEEWFVDTVNGAASIYEYVESKGVENPNLSYQYVYDFSPLLEDRLLVGGYRLAYVLNMIFG